MIGCWTAERHSVYAQYIEGKRPYDTDWYSINNIDDTEGILGEFNEKINQYCL